MQLLLQQPEMIHFASLTLASSSVRLVLVTIPFLSVLSGSTIYAGSGADSIRIAKGVSSEVYVNQGNDYITFSDATSSTLAGGKGTDSIGNGGNVTGD